MSAPAISVIIAVRNAERYLRDCLDSVMAQTFTDFEIVVVDAHSTDRTQEIACAYELVRFLQQTGDGFANAWNCGIAAARGAYVAFIDSDDRWAPDKLDGQHKMLIDEPELQAVIGMVQFFAEPGAALPPGFRLELLNGSHIAWMPGALLAHRTLFESFGDWGEGWVIANDVDWFVRLRDSGIKTGVLPRVVIHKRVHDANLSYSFSRTEDYRAEMLRVLHASIQRKRDSGRHSGV